MNIYFFALLLFTLQIFYWFVGKFSSKKLSGGEDYFLAGKTVKLFPLTMTFLATQVGGGVVLGAAEEAFLFGWPVLCYPFGVALGLIILGAGIGSKLANFRVSTVAQIFAVVYKSENLKRIASILSIISLFMILVGQIIASSKFLVSLGLTSTPLFILFWGIVIIYTSQGGLRAVISTDIVQAAFFSLVFLFCFAFVFFSNSTLVETLSIPQWNSIEAVSSKFTGWLLMPLLFMLIEQDMGQRCFAGASSKIVSRACLFAGISTLIVCAVPVFFGTLAKVSGWEAPAGGSILMTAVERMTNPWLASIVGCAVLAAIISTATSLINAIGSNLSNDFSWLQNSLKKMQWSTAVISICAIYFAFYFENIVDLLIQSYELSVSCLFVPIFIALFRREGNYLGAWLSLLFGAVGFVFFRIYPIVIPKEIASLLLSLLGFSLGEGIAFIKAEVIKRNLEQNY